MRPAIAPVESVTLSGSPTSFAHAHRPPAAVLRLIEGRPSALRCFAVGGYPPPTVELHLSRRDVTNQFALTSQVKMSGERGA